MGGEARMGDAPLQAAGVDDTALRCGGVGGCGLLAEGTQDEWRSQRR